jgi:nitroimidazol reductase NimA-like FMN-containing flavoprotein (pyridoxamine 5'-phosphate oxidase superfamily)
MTREPVTELDARFGEPSAVATSWADGRRCLADAELSWLTTVRANGHPHVTPLMTAWVEDGLYFCTGATEQKAQNLNANPSCVVTTGSSALRGGLDVVLESAALAVNDDTKLRQVADAYETKYGPDWHYDVDDGSFVGRDGSRAIVFELRPTTVFGFAKDPYGQTRWRFPQD